MKKKYTYLEIIRILAIFFVIYNHTGEKGLFLYTQYPLGSMQFWAYLFVTVLFRVPIQLFFAISGALLLHRANESLKDLWTKKISKIALVLFLASFAYYLLAIAKSGEPFSIKQFLIELYSTNIAGHLWYLYAYLAFLVSLPFLRSLVQGLEDKYFYYMIAIAVFFDGIVPVSEYLLGQWTVTMNNSLRVTWITANVLLYPCIGYFIHHRLDMSKIKSKLILFWVVDLLCICTTCYTSYYLGVTMGRLDETFYYSFVLVHCITIYVTAKCFAEGVAIPEKVVHVIEFLAANVFGTYLFHMWLLDSALMNQFYAAMISISMNPMLAVWILSFAVMVIGMGITWVCRKIPYLKKLF